MQLARQMLENVQIYLYVWDKIYWMEKFILSIEINIIIEILNIMFLQDK